MTEESYTCIDCGKNHLKLKEIVWMEEDEDGDIDLSTVRCISCHARFLPTSLVGKIPEDVLKVVDKPFKKYGKRAEYNYNRRTVRRALKKS